MLFIKLLSTAIRRGHVALAVAGALFLSGCSWESWLGLNGKQSTFEAGGPVAREQLQVFYTTCWVTLVIFIFVAGALAYAIIRFRARTEADERAEPPPQGHGNPLIEVSLIGASVLALVIIAVPTLRTIWYTYDVPEEEKTNAYTVTATGYQWWFQFEYPNEQIPGAGPLVTANELVIPAGRPVRVNLRSMDVMHSFWVPKLAGKVDMIPNRANFLWLEADHPGYFWGQCAEFCGESHAVMRFRVIALGQKEFYEWLGQQMLPARTVPLAAESVRSRAAFASLRNFGQNETGVSGDFEVDPLDAWRAKQFPEKGEDPGLIARGKELFAGKTCITCHTIRGYPLAVGVVGPDLTHVGARSTIAAGVLDNNAEQLRRWVHDPGAVKPGNKMWVSGYLANHIRLAPEDEIALVAFLQSLK
jgi:cytochrome c oxidase subunit 2